MERTIRYTNYDQGKEKIIKGYVMKLGIIYAFGQDTMSLSPVTSAQASASYLRARGHGSAARMAHIPRYYAWLYSRTYILL